MGKKIGAMWLCGAIERCFLIVVCFWSVLFLCAVHKTAQAGTAPLRLTVSPTGAGSLLELGADEYENDEISKYFDFHGRLPGATVRGKGRSLTVLHGPLVFSGAFPEMSDLTVLCKGRLEDYAAFIGPNGQAMRACVIFENAITATTTNVTIRADVVGLRTLVHTINGAGEPQCDWKDSGRGWPYRHDSQAKLWRDSKSEHRNIEIQTKGGGGILLYESISEKQLQAWRDRCGKSSDGSFANHVRFIGGHTWDGTPWKWHRCRLGLIDNHDCNRWREHLAPNAALTMHGYTAEFIGHHLDVMPRLGVLMYGTAKLDFTGSGSYIEPTVNWRRATDWHPSGAPGWIIGGDAVGFPQWTADPGGPVKAGNFRATSWPPYIWGENGDALFQKTATW